MSCEACQSPIIPYPPSPISQQRKNLAELSYLDLDYINYLSLTHHFQLGLKLNEFQLFLGINFVQLLYGFVFLVYGSFQ